jgi:hypothetical protein
VADDSLTAGMHVDVLHRDLLLALAAMMVQGVEQHGIGPGKLVRLTQVLASPLKRLLANHRAPIAFHGGIVGGKQLSGDHAFQLVFRPNAD